MNITDETADPRAHEFKLNEMTGECATCGKSSLAHIQKINIALLRESLEAGCWTSAAIEHIINAVTSYKGAASS